MVQIAQEREKIRRAKEIIRTTNSEKLKRDLTKYVHRAEGEIRLALSYIQEGKTCHEDSTPTALRT
nr:MAG TPA: hypothetical protein [Caudoviricetes sp.]